MEKLGNIFATPCSSSKGSSEKKGLKSPFLKKFWEVFYLVFPCSNFSRVTHGFSPRGRGWMRNKRHHHSQTRLFTAQTASGGTNLPKKLKYRSESGLVVLHWQSVPSKSNNPDFTPLFPEQQGKKSLCCQPSGSRKVKGNELQKLS